MASTPHHSLSHLQRYLVEALSIIVLMLAIMQLIALLTWSPTDPGFSRSATAAVTHNYIGTMGAYSADLLYSILGWSTWAFVLQIAIRAAVSFMQSRCNTYYFSIWLFTVRVIALGFSTVGVAMLFSEVDFGPTRLNFGAGGVVGASVVSQISPSIGTIGTILMAIAMIWVGIVLLFEVSVHRMIWNAICAFAKGFVSLIRALKRTVSRVASKPKKHTKEKPTLVLKKPMAEPKLDQPKREPVLIKHPVATPKAKPSGRLAKEKQGELFTPPASETALPNLDLLDSPSAIKKDAYSSKSIEALSMLLESRLKEFGITATVEAVLPGPVVTRFEIQPAAGIKGSRITGLARDLARSLAVQSVRVVEIIPGKSVVGIEIPNENRSIVYLQEVLDSTVFEKAKSPLTMALGHDISGAPIVADLAKMPHLLVAGTTGSGKSVGVNVMILSILYKSPPKDVRLILIDPKMLELSVYDDIPHLLTPVITDMNDAENGLRWCVGEMERRYKLMSKLGVRNLAGFNKMIAEAEARGEPIKDPLYDPEENYVPEGALHQPPALEHLPSIVVVIDEFADMMMIVGKKVEQLIARIAQKARAAGIHLILATQRPSVDVITGLIKANVPTRIGFQVSSKVDSRTILDQGGAEQLLGYGDMLFLAPGTSDLQRVHGAFVDDHEVHAVVTDWKKRGKPNYIESITNDQSHVAVPGIKDDAAGGGSGDESDPLYDEAVAFVTEKGRVSVSSVQRQLRVGYNRAARIVDAMQNAGVVSEPGHNGARKVIAPKPVR